MNKTISVGIAGFGMSGQMFHAPFLNADKRFEIKKVFERASNRSQKEYPYVDVVRSFEELLTDDIDLVVICLPNPQHFPAAKEAIEAGKNVIIEKPVTVTSAEAAELCRLAKERNVLLSVYQNRRLDSDFLTIKKLIENGELGEVLDYEAHFDRFVTGTSSKQWKAEGGAGIGVLYDLGVHIIDQAYTLFGMPIEVYADLRKQRPETVGYDNFQVNLYYENTKAILSAGEVVAHQGPHYIVNGRKGNFIKYEMDVQGRDLDCGLRPPMENWGKEPPEQYGTLYYAADGKILEKVIPSEIGDYGLYYDNIYRALTNGDKLLVPPEETVDVMRIIEAAEESNRTKRRVAL